MYTNSVQVFRGFSVVVLFAIAHIVQAAPNAKLIEFWDDLEPLSVMRVKHDAWQGLLNSYLDDQHPSGINRFDYQGVSDADENILKDYIRSLERMEPRQLSSNEAKAYWVNFYNALLVDMLVGGVKDLGIKSVRDLRGGAFRAGAWRRKSAVVLTQEISLDDIEHGILRPIWNDPRIHYALTSGSLGGGNLQKQAYTADNIEDLLSKSEREYLNHPRGIEVDGKRAQVSSIFDWYRKDFAPNRKAMLLYFQERVDEPTKQALNNVTRLVYRYDWRLNDG